MFPSLNPSWLLEPFLPLSVGICAVNTALCPVLFLRLSRSLLPSGSSVVAPALRETCFGPPRIAFRRSCSFRGHGAQSVSSGPGKIRVASVWVSAWQAVPERSVRRVGVPIVASSRTGVSLPHCLPYCISLRMSSLLPHTTLYLCFLEKQVKIFCTRSGPGMNTLWCHLKDLIYQSFGKEILKTGGKWAEGTPWCVKSHSISWSCFLENTNKI